jgi:hypothetical protein
MLKTRAVLALALALCVWSAPAALAETPAAPTFVDVLAKPCAAQDALPLEALLAQGDAALMSNGYTREPIQREIDPNAACCCAITYYEYMTLNCSGGQCKYRRLCATCYGCQGWELYSQTCSACPI